MARTGKGHSIANRITLITLVFIVIGVSAMGLLGLSMYYTDSIHFKLEAASGITSSIALSIDGDLYAQIARDETAGDGYWTRLKAYLDQVKTETRVKYLYALNNDIDGEIMFVCEGATPDDDPELICEYGTVLEPGFFPIPLYDALATGQTTRNEVPITDEFGTTITSYSPILDSNGQVVGVVCADLDVNEVMSEIRTYALRIVLSTLAITLLTFLFIAWYVSRDIRNPVREIIRVSDHIAVGDVNFDFSIRSRNEIGLLADSFRRMIEGIREQTVVLDALARGDLTASIRPRSENDVMNLSIQSTLDNLNELLFEIQRSVEQVGSSSEQIARTSQNLAAGATEQAAIVQQFNVTISEVSMQADENTRGAYEALGQVEQVGQLMDVSIESMNRMIDAMNEIRKSADKIAKVIDVIDEIAFQTNILSLNASVEAAHAGEHGAGFAVVAGEVRRLSARSAEAAKETTALITNSRRLTAEGDEIARKTSESIKLTGELARSNSRSMNKITESSNKQGLSMSDITGGVKHIAAVVTQNSETAEHAAATAEMMSAQANRLSDIVRRFSLRSNR